jgi:hypothetical protein
MQDKLHKILHYVFSILIALTLVTIGAKLANKYNWPCLHTWALVHGMFFVLFPIYCVFSFLLLKPLIKKIAKNQTGQNDRRVSFYSILSVISSSTGLIIPFIGSLIGIILGHLARKQCRTNHLVSGSGIAMTGLIIGYTGLIYQLYIFVMLWFVAGKVPHGG